MARNRNLKKRTAPKKVVLKPVATLEDILRLAILYNTMYPEDTPEDIYNRRNLVHEAMGKFANAQDIEDGLRKYAETYGNLINMNDSSIVIPWDRESIFPGYQPVINHGQRPDFEDESVIGYEPMPLWVPDDALVVGNLNEDDMDTILTSEDYYAPDFLNSYAFYTFPEFLKPLEDKYVPPTLEKEPPVEMPTPQLPELEVVVPVTYDYPSEPVEQTPEVIDTTDDVIEDADLSELFDNPELKDFFDYQYQYAKSHNGVFDYSDIGLGQLMDAYHLTPTELYYELEDRHSEYAPKVWDTNSLKKSRRPVYGYGKEKDAEMSKIKKDMADAVGDNDLQRAFGNRDYSTIPRNEFKKKFPVWHEVERQ